MRQVGMEELIGHVLGRGEYRLVARLGAGGMGAVYEAEQTGLGRRVAVKVLWPHLTREPGLVERFNREARIAARLDHPHILPVYGFGEEGGLLYLVMRLVRGGSLKDRLRGEGARRAGWSPREALELARQALPPLDYAHRQGVVHRDLKPDNILLEPSDDFTMGYRVFLSDFGIARLVQGDEIDSALTQTGGALGTPAYMAPEQVLDQHVDGRADLYAFGVVLFEILVGQVPYRGHTPLGVAMQHVREPLPAPRELNPRLTSDVEAVLLRALAKDRNERFSSGAALIDALAEAVERSGTDPLPTQSRTRSPSPTSTHAPPRVEAPPPADPSISPVRSVDQQPRGNATARHLRYSERRWWPRLLMLAFATLLVGLVAVAGGLLATDAFAPRPGQPTPAPTLDPATQTAAAPATPPDPQPWVVQAADLGPGWTMIRESTAGAPAQLNVYEVDYASASDPAVTAGFSLFSAASAADADSGLQQLRQAAEASGVVFESIPGLVDGQPALRGRGTPDGDTSRVSIVYLFRVNTVVAAVESIGAADQEASLRTTAEHNANLQRDHLVAASAVH